MCGFVGYTGYTGQTDHELIIKTMSDKIAHRGPDSYGSYHDEQVHFGFRRLSIIDISTNASQPMFNEDGDIVVVFNGEIYNFQELKEDLIEKGHVFSNHSDTEVLVHGYEEYGANLLPKLRGMFAFAIQNKRTGELFFARDFFGIKPLYYTQNTTDHSLLFGSEIKAFLEFPTFKKEFNENALQPYLTFQYSALDESFFKGVFKLKPGHYMIYKDNTVSIHQYYDVFYKPKTQTLDEAVEAIQDTVTTSVAYHKISDVKVGSFLSGGIDSSFITSILKPNHTFTVGFSDYSKLFNETDLAKELSDILEIKNHKKMISADEFFDHLSLIQYHMDEPQSNLSSVPLFFLAQLARKYVTVVLSGEGADEIFGGYSWYEQSGRSRLYQLLPLSLRQGLAKLANKLPSNRFTQTIVRGAQQIEDRFIGQAYIFSENEANAILKTPYQDKVSIQSVTQPIYDKVKDADPLSKMQYLDRHLWLVGDILLKADKMSMAHSLELRVPFLDRVVMDLAAGLKPSYRYNKKDGKYALRLAAEKVIPKAWARREKIGFNVPFLHWIRQEKYYQRVHDIFSKPFVGEFFDQEALLKLLDDHYQNHANHARKIYTTMTFLIWYQVYFLNQ